MAQAEFTHNDVRRLFYLRIVKLRQVGVQNVVVVFDGEIKPALKRATLQQRRFQRERYTKTRTTAASHRLIGLSLNPSVRPFISPWKQRRPFIGVDSLMDFLVDLGVPSKRCSGESDSLLAEMNARGEIDAIISDDVDGFLFGGRRIIRGFSVNAKSPMFSYDMRDIESRLNLDREKVSRFGPSLRQRLRSQRRSRCRIQAGFRFCHRRSQRRFRTDS